jgi:hypothetical protein
MATSRRDLQSRLVSWKIDAGRPDTLLQNLANLIDLEQLASLKSRVYVLFLMGPLFRVIDQDRRHQADGGDNVSHHYLL